MADRLEPIYDGIAHALTTHAHRYARLATVIETARLQKHNNIQDFLF